MEIWKNVPDYENYYEVSNTGEIRDKNTGELLKTYKKEYERVRIKNKIISTVANVHKIVAETFIPNPDNKLIINHKDGNKFNNHVDNLEWFTHSENTRHAIKIGLLKYGVGYNNKPILQYDKDGNFIKEWKSATEVSKTLKISRARLYKVLDKDSKALGYIWKRKER